MSYMMCSRITFPANKRREELVIYTISSVHIESSWKMLTDSAEIVLPRRIKYFAGKDLKELLSAGDQVKIELGYDSNLYTEFEGYISLIGWGVPVTIRCEDEMYNLKRKTVSYSAKNVTLKKLLADVAKGYEVKTNYDAELGAVRYSSRTVAEILNDIRKKRRSDPSWVPTAIATMPQLRMTRRIQGEYTLDEGEMHKYFADSVGMVSDWRKRGPIYEVPFSTLYSAKVKNLIMAGRCTSVTDAMWDIMRVIPCCAVTGQAAGTAAALTEDFSAMDIRQLQQTLKNSGVILHERELNIGKL